MCQAYFYISQILHKDDTLHLLFHFIFYVYQKNILCMHEFNDAWYTMQICKIFYCTFILLLLWLLYYDTRKKEFLLSNASVRYLISIFSRKTRPYEKKIRYVHFLFFLIREKNGLEWFYGIKNKFKEWNFCKNNKNVSNKSHFNISKGWT